ncbi:MAG: flavoprotein [Arachnia sp.]
MNPDELRDVVRAALLEVISAPPRRGLVVFSGALLGFDDAQVSLARLAASGAELDYIQTPSARRILDQEAIARVGMREVSRSLVAEHSLLILPTLTANLAAKAAHGVADCLASNLVSEFIMTGKGVVASRTPVCPDGQEKRSWFPHMPEGYAALLRANLTTLQSFGVRLCDSSTISRTAIAVWDRIELDHRQRLVAQFGPGVLEIGRATSPQHTPVPPGPAAPVGAVRCTDRLISQRTLAAIPDEGVLEVLPEAKITALAADLAARRSILIRRKA